LLTLSYDGYTVFPPRWWMAGDGRLSQHVSILPEGVAESQEEAGSRLGVVRVVSDTGRFDSATMDRYSPAGASSVLSTTGTAQRMAMLCLRKAHCPSQFDGDASPHDYCGWVPAIALLQTWSRVCCAGWCQQARGRQWSDSAVMMAGSLNVVP